MDSAWLKQEMEKRGHGAQAALAQLLGIGASGMSKRVNGQQPITVAEAELIRRWLGETAPRGKGSATQQAAAGAARDPAQALAPLPRLGRQDLPVWAAAQGGEEGAMLITTSPVEWIVRPRELEVADAFAVFLIGESMSPRYDHGDQLFIHPHRPPRPGDDCLFIRQQDDTSFFGLAKTLLRATAGKWHVRQFNPQKDFDLDRRQWTRAWKIVGKMNRV
jgi:phage repressor protein C with HTH and peptisase S24 domain